MEDVELLLLQEIAERVGDCWDAESEAEELRLHS